MRGYLFCLILLPALVSCTEQTQPSKPSPGATAQDSTHQQNEGVESTPTVDVPAGQAVPKEITNSIGMKLVLIPKGTFQMGSPESEGARNDKEIPHEVTITKDYHLGVYEVTQGQYVKIMGKNPSYFQGNKIDVDSTSHPVEQILWWEAVEFCERLTELPEEKKAGRVYRLPTEAEWEYACRAGSKAAYCFGDETEQLSNYAWSHANSGKKTYPVGEKKPNAWGLYDIHGNVWEWCSDWFSEYPQGAVSDPTGPREGKFRVLRGGSWLNDAAFCRSAQRWGTNLLSFRNFGFGFRVALTPSVKQPEADGAETSEANAPVSNAITEPTKAPSTEKMSPGVPTENLEARIDRFKGELLQKEAEIEELRKQGKGSPGLNLEVQMLRRGEQSGK